MLTDTALFDFLTQYQLPAVFLGAFLFGETALLTAGYLMARLGWSPVAVFLIALAGTITADAGWFFLGAHATKFVERWTQKFSRREALFESLKNLSERSLFTTMLYIKFLYGTRILMITYAAWRKLSFWKFLLFDTIGTAIWLVVVLVIGYLAGKSIANLIPAFEGLTYLLLTIFLGTLLLKVISLWMSKRVPSE